MVRDSFTRSSLDVPLPSDPPTSTRRVGEDTDPPRQSPDERVRTLVSEQWRSNDPRSSSTQSLRPIESSRDGHRTLLLIYVHGFMGNEMSFQSFPAHIHNLLNILVAETHVVHTKLYPRYKSRKAVEFARDDFSEWLEPNETTSTDVVLLGHSMGGILSADVALLTPRSPIASRAFRHRILGTIGFDTPFLGLHPGVIVSGIGSIFRPAANPPGFNRDTQSEASAQSSQMSLNPSHGAYRPVSPQLNSSLYPTESMSSLDFTQSTSSLSTVTSNDPNFNPPFPNDKHIVERKGWSSVLHFINKHSDSLTSATKQYFISHLEFGSCLADYPGLKTRYTKIRALEDVDELSERYGSEDKSPASKVRFVNYWTASTGYPKKECPVSSPTIDSQGYLKPMEVELKDVSLSDSSSRSITPTPSISVEEYSDERVTKHPVEGPPDPMVLATGPQVQNSGGNSSVHENEAGPLPEMQDVDPIPINDNKEPINESAEDLSHVGSEPPLPPIPPIPSEPQLTDLTVYTNKDSRKIAEKEQKRVVKAYQQALKDREHAIKDRRKLAGKQERKASQAREKLTKANKKQRLKVEKEEEREVAVNLPPQRDPKSMIAKSKRDKKFCMMPPEINGRNDKCWIRVHMEGVDEVGAHCGLFFPGSHYESLVGDVAARIESWVKEDATRRILLEGEVDERGN